MMAPSLNLNLSAAADSRARSLPTPVATVIAKSSSSSLSSSSVADVVYHHNNHSSLASESIIIASDKSSSSSIAPSLSQPQAIFGRLAADNLTTITKSNNSNTTNSTSNNQPDWFDLPKMDNFADLFSIGCSTAVIFGGLIPYVPQYLKIKKSMSSDGFSTYVCLTLLLANILRIMFWFGHHFEMPLLIQSFVMIVGMLAMMHICVKVRDKTTTFTTVTSSLGGAAGPSGTRRRLRMNGKLQDDDHNKGDISTKNSINNDSNNYINNHDLTAGDDGNNSDGELTPIYSVPSSSLLANNSIAQHSTLSSSSSYCNIPETQESRYSPTNPRGYNIMKNSNSSVLSSSPQSIISASSYQNGTIHDSVGYSPQSAFSSRSLSRGDQIFGINNDDNIESISIHTIQSSSISGGYTKCEPQSDSYHHWSPQPSLSLQSSQTYSLPSCPRDWSSPKLLACASDDGSYAFRDTC